MKKSWSVNASSFNRETGMRMCVARIEVVDNHNALFARCDSIVDVKTAYERFWNDLNPKSANVVFVSEVLPL